MADLRAATFNASLNRGTEGQLIRDLSTPDNAQARTVAEIIQRNNPDVVLVNEFDFDRAGPGGAALAPDLFRTNYLRVSQNGAPPVDYPFVFIAPSNTGISSGLDLNNNGTVVTTPNTPGYCDDSLGFGDFPGQFGMVLFSKFPIDVAAARTFQNFRWEDMPGARLPDNAATPQPQDFYSVAELDIFPLSSKSHWDVPVNVRGETVHILASHPTPPVFDGPEDRNGLRNADEIRLFADYITPGRGEYLYDDQGRFGGLAAGERFVIMGDQNADPLDGDSVAFAINQLLNNPLVDTSFTPASGGAIQQSALQGGANRTHRADPRFDTADFADTTPGNLRADYVLPSQTGFDIESGGVFWPLNTDPLFRLVGTFTPSLPGGFPSSDHRLVLLDLNFTEDARRDVGAIEFIGQATFPNRTQFRGTEVGGLSGITYERSSNSYFSVSDDRSQINPARFYQLNIDLADGRLQPGDVTFTDVRSLTSNGATFPALSLDPEGIALTGAGFYIASEGEATAQRLTDPFVRLFDRGGAQIGTLPVDAKFLPVAGGATGIRNNLAFESLTVTPDGGTLYTATENALASDGPLATTASGSASRIVEYDLATGTARAEYVYVTEPVAAAPVPAGQFSTNGLVDLLAIDDSGTLLAVERSFSTGVGNAIRLFQVSTDTATDVSGARSLPTQITGGQLTVGSERPVQKELLLDFARLGIPLDNVEGVTFGPRLADGRQSLILVSDNNFDATQFTQVLAFAIDLRTGAGPFGPSVVNGGAANNAIFGNDERDFLFGEVGNDTLDGGAGDDLLVGQAGVDILTGEAGNDVIDGGSENDVLDGGAGNDTIGGAAGNDIISAGVGNDYVSGGDGADFILGGDGEDLMIGSLGTDTIFGGAGSDVFYYTAGDGTDVIVDFVPGFQADVIDLIGTRFATFAGVQASLSFFAAGNATVLDIADGAQLLISGVRPEQLDASDFWFNIR